MPDVSDMTQYELIELLKSAAAELVEREESAMLSDDGVKLAREIEQHVSNYDDYVERRPIG